MLDFFVGLFGIGYYGAKILRDDFRSADYDSNKIRYDATNEGFGLKVIADESMEKEIDEMLKDRSRFDEIYELIADNLREVFGNNFRDAFVLKPYNYYYSPNGSHIPNQFWAKQLWLSKHGKVAKWQYKGEGYGLGAEPETKTNIQICRQIEKNLQEAQTGLRLVLKPRYGSIKWDPRCGSMIFEHQLFWKENPANGRLW